MTEFTEGVNTYHIVPIIMQGMNADSLIQELEQKADSGMKKGICVDRYFHQYYDIIV